MLGRPTIGLVGRDPHIVAPRLPREDMPNRPCFCRFSIVSHTDDGLLVQQVVDLKTGHIGSELVQNRLLPRPRARHLSPHHGDSDQRNDHRDAPPERLSGLGWWVWGHFCACEYLGTI